MPLDPDPGTHINADPDPYHCKKNGVKGIKLHLFELLVSAEEFAYTPIF